MRHKLAKVKSVIARFWKSKEPKFDELALNAELMQDVYFIDEQKLNELIAERDRLKKAKKRHRHLDPEIHRIRTHQLIREMA